MNTSALKVFAPAVRRQLMEAVALKLDFVLAAQTPDYLSTFAPQVSALRKLAQENRQGLVERVAYTWFNRFTALRYLDARGWHPFNARILTPATPDETQPELLKLFRTGSLPKELKDHTDSGRLNDLLDGRIPSPDPQGEVYRHLVLAACHFYHALLPDVFERLDDETELLLADDLLTEHSVAQPFRTEITDEDCAEVEIIGWLYQFYTSERKDQIIARKSAVPTEDIPAVTQLFTPHWIVRYVVENSLGRLWLLNRPGSRLREQMPYYIEGEPETDFLKITKPEEIRVVDPAVGSGHMLTYAFDLLYAIYAEEGYPTADIPGLILEHNLFGLEIDCRAAQLAEMALVFKAREKSKRFFQSEHLVHPKIVELRDVSFGENELRHYIRALGLSDIFNETVLLLLHQFEDAKNVGSLIQPCLDEQAIDSFRRKLEAKDLDNQLFLHETHAKVVRVLKQAGALAKRYHVVVANPPYMGTKGMNGPIKTFIKANFENYKTDLFAAFVVRAIYFALPDGRVGFMTPFVWMFLSSFEQLRQTLLTTCSISSLVQPEYHAFFESAYVPVCAFTFSKRDFSKKAVFIRLHDFYGEAVQSPKVLEAIANPDASWRFEVNPRSFLSIPGAPFAYWISEKLRNSFSVGTQLGEIASPRQGLATGENDRFVRLWYEVSKDRIAFHVHNGKDALATSAKWFPYNKGGEFRRWYGNQEFIVNWENDGALIRNFIDADGRLRSRPQNTEHYFEASVSWSKISSALPAFRYFPNGFVFDVAGTSIFAATRKQLLELLAFTNCIVAQKLLQVLSPTLNFEVGHISVLPIKSVTGSVLPEELIALARADWDNFETSWDFGDLPLLRPGLKRITLALSWEEWRKRCAIEIHRMRELEMENNRLFIAAYDLDGELQPAVPEEQITLARADAGRDVVAFLSYAVGCLMGRYSLDQPGLIVANAGDSLREYLEKVKIPQDKLTFAPDEDGIIPVLDGEWFEDDIVARTREFLRATFGEATLKENIRFIEDSLGKDLRKYFLTDFYRDHLRAYKKRPIYWMIQSPRKGFSVLIYLHRYTRDTMNLVLNKYLREYQVKLRSRLDQLTKVQANDSTSARDKTAARKEADKLSKTLHDCEEWERRTILPLAQARIELDLDDGVKANYLKLGEALAPIAAFAAEDE